MKNAVTDAIISEDLDGSLATLRQARCLARARKH